MHFHVLSKRFISHVSTKTIKNALVDGHFVPIYKYVPAGHVTRMRMA